MDRAFISADNRRSDLNPAARPPGRSPEAQRRERERSDMTTKSRLYLGVAALAIAVVLTGSVVEVSAQQSATPAVAIDNDDIGGVVTGPNGPEAGVWVIAETTRSADPLRQDRRHRRPGPLRRARSAEGQLQGLGARLRPRRFAEGRRASPASSSTSRRCRRRTTPAAAQYYPAIYWYSMLKIPDAERVRRQRATSRPRSRRPTGSTR